MVEAIGAHIRAQDIAIGYAERRGIEPWNDPLPQGALLRCLFHHAISSYHRSRARERDGVQRLCANLANIPQQSVEQMAVEHLTFNELQSQMSPFMRETANLMLACSQWDPQGCSSEPPWNPLCADTNERLCSDTPGYCQTQ